MIRILVHAAGADSPVVAEVSAASEGLAEDVYGALVEALPGRFVSVVIPE